MAARTRSPRGDDGVALFSAVAVAAIAGALILVILGYAVSAARDSAVDRGRAVAVATVEGVVDTAYAALQTSAPDSLPCSVVPGGVLGAGPDGAAAQATVRYLQPDGSPFVGGAPGECLPAGYSPQDVAGAVITASGKTAARGGVRSAKRKMESYVKLTPVFVKKDALAKAIYASGTVSFTNNATMLGDQGSDADVYAGAGFVCANALDVSGNLYVQGTTTFANTCSVKGDLHSLGAVTINNASTIGGRVISSTGGVALNNPQIAVGNVVRAAFDITGQGGWTSCSQPKCQRYLNPAPAPPPVEGFPVFTWDPATAQTWFDVGYTHVVENNDCNDTAAGNGPTRWFLDNAARLPGKSVLLTTCQIKLSGDQGKTLKLKDDLLVIARGGFVTTNLTTFGSTVPGTSRNLHWVIPHDVTASRPCSSPPLSTSNQFGLTADIKMLLYSPCDISFANQATHIGQIYGGSNVVVNNKFTLQFRPVPFYGVQLPPSTTTLESFKVDIVYKRETV